jgi:hypothetical protein
LLCIHCGRVSFIVVFWLNVLLLRVMCVTCLLCPCCTTATGLKPNCSQIINNNNNKKLNTMPWRYMREWSYSSTILDLGISWRWMVSFTPRPLNPWGKSHRYLLDRRLGGPQSRSGLSEEQKNLARAANWKPIVQSVAPRYTDWVLPTPTNYNTGP